MPVRRLDAKSGVWSTLECGAAEDEELPRPRGGHSVRWAVAAVPAMHELLPGMNSFLPARAGAVQRTPVSRRRAAFLLFVALLAWSGISLWS
jgi:hypothetical protein